MGGEVMGWVRDFMLKGTLLTEFCVEEESWVLETWVEESWVLETWVGESLLRETWVGESLLGESWVLETWVLEFLASILFD